MTPHDNDSSSGDEDYPKVYDSGTEDVESHDAYGAYDIVFFTVEDIIYIHSEIIRTTSPGESCLIRDKGLLESAVMNPQQTFGGDYLYDSLVAMGVAYMKGLALNHPFENGNKRIAYASLSTFLRRNGYRLTLNQDEGELLTMNVVNHIWDHVNAVEFVEGAIEEM